MYWLLWVYLGGVTVRTILFHGIMSNPNIDRDFTTAHAMKGIVWWPVHFVISWFK